MPDLCYRLKGRLIKDLGHVMFLRAFEGEIGNNIFKCDNDCCCSNSKGVFELPAPFDERDDKRTIIEAFIECGLSLEPSYTFWPQRLGLSSSCVVYRIAVDGPDPIGRKIQKFNFDLANPYPYYGTL